MKERPRERRDGDYVRNVSRVSFLTSVDNVCSTCGQRLFVLCTLRCDKLKFRPANHEVINLLLVPQIFLSKKNSDIIMKVLNLRLNFRVVFKVYVNFQKNSQNFKFLERWSNFDSIKFHLTGATFLERKSKFGHLVRI